MNIRLTVRVIPRGGADRVEDISQSPNGDLFLKVRVKALPEAGQANAAVEKVLAEFLALPRSHIQLTRGAKSRLKIFSITGDNTQRILNSLAERQVVRVIERILIRD